MKLGTPFLCAVLLACGCGDKQDELDEQAIDTWLVLASGKNDCYGLWAECFRLADGDEQAIESCGASYDVCYETVADGVRQVDGEDGCITAMLDCAEGCGDDEGCYDGCLDDLEECASWYQRDCEETCWDEADECIANANDEHASDLDALVDAVKACVAGLYEDCIPACYDE